MQEAHLVTLWGAAGVYYTIGHLDPRHNAEPREEILIKEPVSQSLALLGHFYMVLVLK